MAKQSEKFIPVAAEFEQKADELISLMFVLTEKRIRVAKGSRDIRNQALSASALAVEKSIRSFLTIEQIR